MATQTLIELRRGDAVESRTDTTYHTDYSVVLKEPLVLHEGDQIQLAQSFVDTVAAAGSIVLQEDIDVTGKYIAWMQDWNPLHKAYGGPIPAAAGTYTGTDENGPTKNPGLYVGCDAPTTVPHDGVNYFLWSHLRLTTGKHQGTKVKKGYYGDTWATFNYVGTDIQNRQFEIFLPKTETKYNMDVYFGVLCAGDNPNEDCSLVNEKELQADYGVEWIYGSDYYTIHKALDGHTTFTPHEEAFDFKVPAGTYTPQYLAEYITAQMSMNNTGFKIMRNDITSPFLIPSTAYTAFVPVADYGSIDNVLPMYFQIDPDNPIWVGASQLALNYDSDAGTFNFSFLHMPLLSTPDGKPAVAYVDFNSEAEKYWLSTAHSGIAFTALKPASLWQDLLGFDLAQLQVNHTWEYNDGNAANIADAWLPRINLLPGINIVTAFAGNDAGLDSTSANYFLVNQPVSASVETSLTTPINAGVGALGNRTRSHFLVEVSGVPMSSLVGSRPTSLGLAGVVGRYQTRGSFTQGSASDGVPITIRGDPVHLSRLHVRIRDPDGGIPTDVGDDSTIFLVVTRHLRLPPPLPPMLASQPPGLLPAPKKSKVAEE